MYLLFDIGGTKSRFALTDDFQTFKFDPVIFYTKKNYLEEIENIKTQVQLGQIDAIIGGFPGILKNNMLTFAPNLTDFVGKNLEDDFKNIFGNVNLHFYNDAKLAALGEAVFGAGKNATSVCYLTFGTGIGGGIVNNKKIDFAEIFEPGHMVSNPITLQTFEEAISGGAIRRKFEGKTPDPTNRDFWSEIERIMAILLVNIFMLEPVDLFVLGGGIIVNGNVNLNNVIDQFKKIVKINQIPEIKSSELGDFSGLYGAMVLLKELYNK